MKALASILSRCMQLAQYFCTGDETLTRDDWCHFALNVPMYTHFTSPIRRYADVIVHRLLMAALYDQATEYTVEHVKTIVDHCNQRKLGKCCLYPLVLIL